MFCFSRRFAQYTAWHLQKKNTKTKKQKTPPPAPERGWVRGGWTKRQSRRLYSYPGLRGKERAAGELFFLAIFRRQNGEKSEPQWGAEGAGGCRFSLFVYWNLNVNTKALLFFSLSSSRILSRLSFGILFFCFVFFSTNFMFCFEYSFYKIRYSFYRLCRRLFLLNSSFSSLFFSGVLYACFLFFLSVFACFCSH